MLFVKIKNKFGILLQYIWYKCIYRKRISIGKKTRWRKRFSVIIEDNASLKIGDNCKFNYDCSIACLGKIDIGANSIFGENVKIYDHNHHFNKKGVLFFNQGMSIGKVEIGENCWIGSNVVVLKDAHIGNNCVIGAGCVVSGIVPDNTILKNKSNYIKEHIKFKG